MSERINQPFLHHHHTLARGTLQFWYFLSVCVFAQLSCARVFVCLFTHAFIQFCHYGVCLFVCLLSFHVRAHVSVCSLMLSLSFALNAVCACYTYTFPISLRPNRQSFFGWPPQSPFSSVRVSVQTNMFYTHGGLRGGHSFVLWLVRLPSVTYFTRPTKSLQYNQ